MNKKNLVISAVLFLAVTVLSNFTFAQNAPQLGKASVDEVIAAMTNEEKAHILIGTGMAGMSGNSAVVGATQALVPGAAGTSYPIPRLGIPAVVLADGPAGLRISPTREGDDKTFYCTGFPVGTVLACTWNTKLVEQVGKAMGNEVLEYGADVLLAPALNIQRNPLNGRNFEYYSEDPVVAGKIAAAMTKGIQSNGVGVSLKHFVANNQETNRTGNDVRVSPRALREIYLKGFEIAVKESDPWTVMSSYNYVNGTYASESKELLTTVLRDEWGFKGLVMTDWFGGNDAVAQVQAGNDLMEPGLPRQYDAIIAAMNSGQLSMKDVDTSVKRVLELVLRSPRFKGYEYSDKPDLEAHAAITRQSAAEGMILLKNNDHAMPLASTVKKVAAFGITSYDLIAGGTGSGDVNKAYTVSLIEGLSSAGYKTSKDISKVYTTYMAEEAAKNKVEGNDQLSAFLPKFRPDEFIPSEDLLSKAVKGNDVAIITIGRTSGEFFDRKLTRDFNLSENEKGLISSVCTAFHEAGKSVIVILNIGGVIETASWKELPDAILLAGQAGQEGGNTIADALTGKVNPSGKLTATYPVNFEDAWSSQNFPVGDAQKVDLSGFMAERSGVKNEVRNVDYTVYAEGIYVGYRYFDKYEVPVSYPFGYGLSYTTFDYSNAKISENNGTYTVSVTVSNSGSYAGKEVVQLYVSAPESKYADKPVKELKAFAKTSELKPGENETVTLSFTTADVASFNTLEQAWITDAGNYKAIVGASSKDLKAELPFEISETTFVEKVHKAF